MIIQIFDYKSSLAEPRSYPFWSPQLGNIQLVVLLRQPVIISLREKTSCNMVTDQEGREGGYSGEN